MNMSASGSKTILHNDLLRQALDELPVAIYLTDADGRLAYFNRAAINFSGHVPQLGSDRWCISFRLFNPDGTPLPHDECPMAVALREGRLIRGVEAIAERPDGTRIPFMPYPTPLRDSEGNIIGGLNVLIDMTEHDRARKRLDESENRHKQLISMLPTAVYTISAPDGKITYYNDRAAELWGRKPELNSTAERFCGSFRLWLADGSHLPHEECPMALALREGYSCKNTEVCMERPDGSRIWAMVNIDPIRDSSGKITGAVNVFQDVTALRIAQQEIRDAARQKDRFIAVLAHELRNPLAPIRSGLDLLRLQPQPGIGMSQTLDVIERQLQHLIHLTDDLLDVNRITTGKVQLKKERVNLKAVLDGSIEAIHPSAAEKKQDIKVALPAEDVFLDGDPVRLTQVFTNILSNAVKYSPAGGSIRVEVALGQEAVEIRVADQGAGIPTESIQSIFEPFVQLNDETNGLNSGLGIGLSLVKHFVAMHGGTVKASSDGTSRGTTFTVRLPSKINRDGEAAAGDLKQDAPSARRILVVDDNKDAADALRLLLKARGHTVDVAYDGAAAIAAIEQQRWEVLLLDIGLPQLSGYEVCRRIRHANRDYRPWIIALTGWGHDNVRAVGSDAAEFDAHLVKPVGLSALDAALSRAKVHVSPKQ